MGFWKSSRLHTVSPTLQKIISDEPPADSGPLGPVIVQEVQGALRDFPGVGEVDVKLVWSPPWSPELMSEEAKDELGIW